MKWKSVVFKPIQLVDKKSGRFSQDKLKLGPILIHLSHKINTFSAANLTYKIYAQFET